MLALFYNIELRLSRLEAGVALADAETAGLWDDPVFGFDGAEILSPSGPFEFGLTLSLTIPVSGRLGVAKDRAEAAHDAALVRIVDAEWNTRSEVRRAWGEWTGALHRVELLRELIDQVERVGVITDRLEAAGELSRVEGRVFRVELADRQASLVAAESRELSARLDILGLLGLPPDADIELEPAFPSVTAPEIDDDVERMIASNTALAVRRAEYQVAEESLRLEIRKQYPDIEIGGGYGNEDDHRLLLGFSVPIPSLNANRAGIAEAKAKRELARAAAEAEFERLVRDLASARAALFAADVRRQQIESRLLPLMIEQSGEVERIAEIGEVDTLLLLETITRLHEIKLRLLDARLAELEAGIAISQLLGPDAPLAAGGDS